MEHDEQRTYSIGELADEVGVSTRTIRYYVSEGLLPPPVGSGPGSRYTEAHRRILIEINALKEQYLPLKEIRKRLIGFDLLPTRFIGEEPVRVNMSAMPPEASALHRSTGRTGYRQPYDQVHDAISMPVHDSDFDVYPTAPVAARPADEPTWRRVNITDEAELLITESQYRHHKDRIDWLVQWVKRVLEP